MQVRRILEALTALCLAGAARVSAQEKAVKRSELPAAVQQTVDAQSKGATVKGFARETENGRTFYEAEMTVNGHSKDLLMDANGNVVEIEEQVSLDSLPAAVREALQKEAEGGTIQRVESLTKRGKLVAWEAVVKNGSERREVQVGPNGEELEQEE